MSLFRQIAPVRAYQEVINQLEEVILSGKLNSGDKLPPERELIEDLGTSRRTLREAFRVLEQKGLIEIKIGSKGGTFVTDRIGERLGESLSLLIRKQSVTQSELAEFRANTEGTIAALVAERATKEELSSIEKRLKDIEKLQNQTSPDIDVFIEKEIALHQQLAESCGNAVYKNIVKTILTVVLYPMFRQDVIESAYIRTAVSDWHALLDALRNKDSAGAKNTMVNHIRYFDQMTDHSAKVKANSA